MICGFDKYEREMEISKRFHRLDPQKRTAGNANGVETGGCILRSVQDGQPDGHRQTRSGRAPGGTYERRVFMRKESDAYPR